MKYLHIIAMLLLSTHLASAGDLERKEITVDGRPLSGLSDSPFTIVEGYSGGVQSFLSMQGLPYDGTNTPEALGNIKLERGSNQLLFITDNSGKYKKYTHVEATRGAPLHLIDNSILLTTSSQESGNKLVKFFSIYIVDLPSMKKRWVGLSGLKETNFVVNDFELVNAFFTPDDRIAIECDLNKKPFTIIVKGFSDAK